MAKVNLIRKDGQGQKRLRVMIYRLYEEHTEAFLDSLDIPEWSDNRTWARTHPDAVDAFATYLMANKILNSKMYYFVGSKMNGKEYEAVGLDITEDKLYTKFLLEYKDD
jgi:hypothetical protein